MRRGKVFRLYLPVHENGGKARIPYPWYYVNFLMTSAGCAATWAEAMRKATADNWDDLIRTEYKLVKV